MSGENDLAHGGKANSIDAESDEERLNREGETTDTEAWPRYSESDETMNWTATAVGEAPTPTGGGDSAHLNEGSTDPLTDDVGSRNETARHTDIIADYFTVIREGDLDRIRALLAAGPITVSSTTREGLTPLLAAIDAGRLGSARVLLEAGADPNAYGVIGRTEPEWLGYGRAARRPREIRRTPLQLAAVRGNLAIVKLLMETYGADDALVAPDGELALRLAAVGGHREIVAYLPARRGGGFRRWKTKHEVAVRRARRAAEGMWKFVEFVGFRVPRFVVWSVPKHLVVLPAIRGAQWLWRHRAELPRLLADRLRIFWRQLKDLSSDVWDLVRRSPKLVWDGVVATVRGIPKAAAIAALWVWNGIQVLAGVIGGGFNRLFSFLHTALVAAGTFFQNATLENVWQGLVAFAHAVAVEGPRRLWHWARGLGDIAIKMLKAMWGGLGELLGWLFWGLAKAVTYMPRKLWEILTSVFNSVGYGGKEVMIWINPKR